ncbi:CBO0543 family protein [Halobacillus naozhouensis]|uniref:Uncharacterized protein n=1 Tax=Halobacillus naozhouensis TaxID=554880 RepID=A0ABY8J6B9_9BACI|nr:CBO0543 family protein [Halobacillus naozhouensis]WFT76446.1 hypothetical protein P9989_08810 [Halobacillus naozhouensis]
MQTSFVLFFIIVGLFFGVWKRWNELYPTLLFWIIGNLLYCTLLHNYRVWEFRPVGIDHLFLPTHTVIAIAITFLISPFVIVVYLGRFSKSILKKVCWIIVWSLTFQAVETIAYYNQSITHHYGWTLTWSFIFNIVTFSILPIHQWKPWVAWLLAALNISLLFIIFDPPIPK